MTKELTLKEKRMILEMRKEKGLIAETDYLKESLVLEKKEKKENK